MCTSLGNSVRPQLSFPISNSASCLSASPSMCISLQEVVQISGCSIPTVQFADGWTYRHTAHVCFRSLQPFASLKVCLSSELDTHR